MRQRALLLLSLLALAQPSAPLAQQTIPNPPGSKPPAARPPSQAAPGQPCNPCGAVPPSSKGYDYSQETDPYLKYAQNVSLRVSQIVTTKFPTVQAFVTVTDEGGQLIRTLKEGDFTAEENGQAVSNLRFGNRDELNLPLAVMFVVDISGSMEPAMAAEIQAIQEFVAKLRPEDRAGLISFSDAALTQVRLTTDRAQLLNEVQDLTPWGQTALWDAIYLGINELVSDTTPSRKALVVLSDGGDNRSLENPQTIQRLYQDDALAKNNGFSIYCLGLGQEIDRGALEQIADKTGGQYFDSPTADDLASVYESILTQLQNEYILEYESPTESQPGQIIDLEAGLQHVQSFNPGKYSYRSPGLSKALARAIWPGLIAISVLMLLLILATIYKLTRRVWLTAMITPLEGRDYQVSEYGAHIGSAESCEIRLGRDPAMLPIHAALSETPHGFMLEAMNSEAPLLVAGQMLMKKLLRNGDRFLLGSTQFVFNERVNRPGADSAELERLAAGLPAEAAAPVSPSAPSAVPQPGAMPKALVAVSGPLSGSRFDLTEGENQVGRSEGRIVLGSDSQVSRRHCTIKISAAGAALLDNGSTNGTRLNGQACQPGMPQALRVGDKIGIGSGEYRVE